MIENFYVGASKHIRQRIMTHLYTAMRPKHQKGDIISPMILETYKKNGSIKVFLLSNDPYNEYTCYTIFKPKCNKPKGLFYHQIKNIDGTSL